VIHIKTGKAIEYIAESSRIVSETLELLRKLVRPGITTGELDKTAEEYILSNDARPAFKGYGGATNPFPASVCISVNDEVVHGIPCERTLKSGDIVSLDVGVVKHGYYGDGAISAAVGEISAESRRLMDVTEQSLHLAIEAAVEKNRVHDISHAVQQHVEKNGYSVVRALCGHGVGKRLHEDPSVPNFGKKGTGAKLKNGMTLAIEPMVNMGSYHVYVMDDGWTVRTKDGKPSAHFEHTILINGNKAEILTKH
jgi:methionyl aminopeptidase